MKWILGIIVILAIAGGALWWSGLIQPWIFPQAPATDSTQQVSPSQSTTGLPTSDSNTSDEALVQDAASIDAQIQALEGDSAAIDGSLNDTPVEQSY